MLVIVIVNEYTPEESLNSEFESNEFLNEGSGFLSAPSNFLAQ